MTPPRRKLRIRELLAENQRRLGVTCTRTGISGCFSELIGLAHQAHGRRVVVLVDEYDKPTLDNIADSETAPAMREGLKNLYSVIKAADAHIHLAFLTGVSRFSKVSLFSGLNNLRDLTLVVELAPEGRTLQQIKNRGYADKYRAAGQPVYLIGVEVSRERRNVVGFEVERV